MRISLRAVRAGLFSAFMLLTSTSARGDERGAPSLKWVPADAWTYGAALRNRECEAAIVNSKAYASFYALPFVEKLWKKPKVGSPLGQNWPEGLEWLTTLQYRLGLAENRALANALQDLLADEVFYLGVGSWKQWLMALDELEPHRLLPFLHLQVDGKPGRQQSLMVGVGNKHERHLERLVAFLARTPKLKAPELVVGFKVRDVAATQKKLRQAVKRLQNAPKEFAQLRERLRKTKIAGHDFYTMALDGSMISWNELPISDAVRDSKDWDKLTAKLGKLKITISAGIRDGYLLVAIGATTRNLEQLGRGPLLRDRPEFSPLTANPGTRLTSIYYASKDAQSSVARDKKAIDHTFRWLLGCLKDAGLPDDLTARLRKDCQGISRDLSKFVLEPGPLLTFSGLTDHGLVTYTYDWTQSPLLKETRPLSILEHMGGEPLLFCAGRSSSYGEKYQLWVKWLKTLNGYIDDLIVPALADEDDKQREQVMNKAWPVLARLDRVTSTMLLPALSDGQAAFVLDAHLKSRRWQTGMPRSARPLALLEPALVVGVTDAPLLRKAMRAYRTGALAEESELHLPPPQMDQLKSGKLFHYELPRSLGFDKRIVPTAGLNKHFAVLAISQSEAKQLLSRTRLKIPLAPQKRQTFTHASHVNGVGLLQALRPWIELAMRDAKTEKSDEELVAKVLQLLGVFRSFTSATYPDGSAMVTRHELVVRDVE